MISVRCPACGKVMGFEESDAGSLVACPLCRESFFIPVIAQPVAAPEGKGAPPAPDPPRAPRLPLEPTLPDPDEIQIAPDPDLDPVPEQIDEVIPVDAPPPAPPPEPEPPPAPIPQLELDAPAAEEEIVTVEPVGTPKEVEPTDLAPSLAAAEELSPALQEKSDPNRPVDVLDEVKDGDERFKDEDDRKDEEDKEDEEDRPRRKSRRAKDELRTPYHAQPPRPEGLTRNRIMGGVGAGLGGMILLGTLAHHLTASANAWHGGVCCGDVFALALLGVGVFYLIRG